MMEGNVNSIELFFPYYVNQSRLFDLYAILNGGYSEYSEMTSSVTSESKRDSHGDVKASGGFKVVKIGGEVYSDHEKKEGTESGQKEKKIQTVTSILSMVIQKLKDGKYFVQRNEIKPGKFVLIPVVLKINSIKSLVDEIDDLMVLSDEFKETEESPDTSTSQNKRGKKQRGRPPLKKEEKTRKLFSSVKKAFDGEEIFCEKDDYAIIGNITDENMYQSVRTDLIGTELQCFAQVKRVFPEGTQLMRNTVFSKIRDVTVKEEAFQKLVELSTDTGYDFESTVVPAIVGKPVYELEIIALYQ